MIVAQVRISDEVPQPPAELRAYVDPVEDLRGRVVDWSFRLTTALYEELEGSDDAAFEELSQAWSQLRSEYLWEAHLGPGGSILSMVETVRHIAAYPVYLHILENLTEDTGEVAPGELESFQIELQMVREELAAKRDYAGWELIAEDERPRPVGYGMRPFENEVLAAADRWTVTLGRDDRVLLNRPGEESLRIRGWEITGDSGGVAVVAETGEVVGVPEDLGYQLLKKGQGARKVRVQRSLLTSVFSKVWSGLYEGAAVAEEQDRPLRVVERTLVSEQGSLARNRRPRLS